MHTMVDSSIGSIHEQARKDLLLCRKHNKAHASEEDARKDKRDDYDIKRRDDRCSKSRIYTLVCSRLLKDSVTLRPDSNLSDLSVYR